MAEDIEPEDGDLVLYQGATLNVLFEVTDDADVPVELLANGYDRAAMQARKRVNSETTLLDLSSQTGEITIEPDDATGDVKVEVGADVTAAVTASGVYDCLVWKSADTTDVLLIAQGRMLLDKRVTRKP